MKYWFIQYIHCHDTGAETRHSKVIEAHSVTDWIDGIRKRHAINHFITFSEEIPRDRYLVLRGIYV